jgi:hypothetical protein
VDEHLWVQTTIRVLLHQFQDTIDVRTQHLLMLGEVKQHVGYTTAKGPLGAPALVNLEGLTAKGSLSALGRLEAFRGPEFLPWVLLHEHLGAVVAVLPPL